MNKLLFLFSFFFLSLASLAQGVQVSNLKCENKLAPSGIEVAAPKLSWELKSSKRNVLQSAYRVLIADQLALLAKGVGNIWDSKKVASSASIQVPVKSVAWLPAKVYYWKVMLWDNNKQPSAWSDVTSFQTGLMRTEDWKGAQWIAYEKIPDSLVNILPTDGKKDKFQGNNIQPLLRKTFTVDKPIKRATVFICGLGHFDLSINGKKIGDHFLDPGWTKYDQQALYVPFDITNDLAQGQNAIGVMLGNGFYYIPPVSGRYRKLKVAFGYPKMKSRLLIEYADGSTGDIVSDNSWKTSAGPITFSSIYGGEDYNANLEQQGWDTPQFNDAHWKEPVLVDGPPVLNAQLAEPVKVMQTFDAKTTTRVGDYKWVYDFGQNASGILQIKVQGKKGDTVRLYPAELLKEDGTVNQRASGSPYYFEYILKGDSAEVWQPRFTYYGFRYAQINNIAMAGQSNPSGYPTVLQVKALHIRNGAHTVGSFACSNDLFNRTYSLIDWSIRSNMVSLFTDCPHREKLGWLEEAHLMGNSIRHIYDVPNLYRKQMADMRYSQTSEGLIPEISPEYVKFEWGGDMFRDSPEWGSNAIIIPWYLYQWYGDKARLEESYDVMKRYEAYLRSKAKGWILSQGLGDWYDLGPKAPGVSQLTPMGVTGTAMYYYDLSILSKVARLLGKEADAKAYDETAVKVKQAFNDSFFHADTKQYATGSQAANAMAVYMNLVEPQYKASVIENIVKDIRSRNNALTAGDIGYRYLLCVLHEAGRDDVIFDMNNRSDVPGYGYQLAKGATALTESWAALPTASNNHLMLGHLMEWFYTGLLGISQVDSSVGYKNIIIKPAVVGDVQWAKGSYKSARGTITSDWKKEGDSFTLNVQIPANTTGVVYLPVTTSSKILESGVTIDKNKSVKLLGTEEGRAKLKIGSGSYQFIVTEKSAKGVALQSHE